MAAGNEVIVVERIAIGAYAALGRTEGVLADDGLKGKGRRELLAKFGFFVLGTVKLFKQLLLQLSGEQICIKIIVYLMLLHLIPFCHIH